MPDNSQRIREIRQLLESGVRSISVDGTTVQIDTESLRRELRELLREDERFRQLRPAVASIYLGQS